MNLKRLLNPLKQFLTPLGYYTRPAFLIIGAQKGGTTSLYHYLARHPLVVSSRDKEIGFFSLDEKYRQGYGWYHAQFPLPYLLKKGTQAFEATPEYLYYPECPERIHRYDPRMKLVVVLRDPVERAYSAWNMFRNFRNDPVHYRLTEERSFEDAVAAEMGFLEGRGAGVAPLERSYVRRGLYFEQIERYLRYFPREQIFITENDLIRSDRAGVLAEISRFLNLPAWDWSSVGKGSFNVGRYEGEAMPDRVRMLLADFYRPHNEKLFQFLGVRYDWQ